LASWMGSAVNTLIPVATIGGEIVKARVLILWSHPGAETAAAMIVDKTVQAVAVLLWGLIGAAILVAVVGASEIALGVLVGAAVLSAGIAGFIAVQVTGGFSAVARSVAVDAQLSAAVLESAERGAPLVNAYTFRASKPLDAEALAQQLRELPDPPWSDDAGCSPSRLLTSMSRRRSIGTKMNRSASAASSSKNFGPRTTEYLATHSRTKTCGPESDASCCGASHTPCTSR